jgi:hypothetical protein
MPRIPAFWPALWRAAAALLVAGAALVAAHPVHVPCLLVLPITGPVGPVPSF